MSESEIRKYDPEDTELKAMFGEKFRDKTEVTENPNKVDEEPEMVVINGSGNSVKVNIGNLGFFKMLGMFLKPVFVFGGMAMLVYYWQNADLMDVSVAIPTMCAFTALMGYGIGKVVNKR